MADEFDPQKFERLLTQLSESVYATALNIERITSPEVFGEGANVRRDSLPEPESGDSELLAGNSVFPGTVEVDLGKISSAEIADDQAGIGVDFGSIDPTQGANLPQLSEEAYPALGTEQIRLPSFESTGFEGGGLGDSLSLEPSFSFGVSDQESIDAAFRNRADAESVAATAPDAAGGSPPSEVDFSTVADEAGPPFDSAGSPYSPSPDFGNEDAVASSSATADANAVDLPPNFDFPGDYRTEGGLELGFTDDIRKGTGYQHSFEGEDQEEMLQVIGEYHDQERTFRRNLIAIWQKAVADLRTDNALLADIRRHFEQSRRAY